VRRKAFVRFFVVALGLYGALTLGWPGFGDHYAKLLRATLRSSLASEEGLREIEIPAEQPATRLIRVEIANRALLASDGSGPVRNVDLPTATFWNASALCLALSLATPYRWRPRVLLTIAALIVVQIFIAGVVCYALWNEGRFVELSAIPASWAGATDRFQIVLIEQASLVVPVIAWLVSLAIFGGSRGTASGFSSAPRPAAATPRFSEREKQRAE
jgi:hypothetical protein